MEYTSNGFEVILRPQSKCPYTGKEIVLECIDKRIKCFFDKEGGSKRFVLYVSGRSVAALQIMINGRLVQVANVITIKEQRRKGYAKSLWIEAKKHHAEILHSPNLSPEGQIFSQRCY